MALLTHHPFRRRVAAVALVLASTAWGASLAPATATTGHGQESAARAALPTGTVFKLTFDGRGRVRDGTVFKNQAGKGRVEVELLSGRFKRVKGKPGKALRYPVEGGYGLLEGPDRRAWDPGARDFRFGARIKVSRAQASRHMNVIQKGYFKQSGGQWKLQVDAGRPSCVVRGDVDRVLVRGEKSVIDGRWHRLACSRTESGGVRLLVDGDVAASSDHATGSVANGAPLRLGAKKLGTGQVDQFHGRLDVPFLFIAPPPS
jgi:hypothetical protein